MRYLPVNVYANTDGYDCTNKDITLTHQNKLVVECETGFMSEETIREEGYIVLVPHTINGYTYLKAKGEKRHTMMGGNFVYSSDSRFRKLTSTPIAVHDRIE